MNEVACPKDKIKALEVVLRGMPQVEPPTYHHFANGMYLREMHLAKDLTIVGKIHKQEHFFILAKGKLAVTVNGEVKVIDAPAVMVGKPGEKRAGHAMEDCVCINVHKTDKIDLDEIEAEVIEYEPGALLGSSNKLKVLT